MTLVEKQETPPGRRERADSSLDVRRQPHGPAIRARPPALTSRLSVGPLADAGVRPKQRDRHRDQPEFKKQRERSDPIGPIADVLGVTRNPNRAGCQVAEERSGTEKQRRHPAQPLSSPREQRQ